MTEQQQRETVSSRIAKGHPWHRVPHRVADNQTYILTGTCLRHRPVIEGVARREEFAASLQEQVEQQGADIFAWCVLPNHYHLLLRCDLKPTEAALGRLHGTMSRQWNLEDNQLGRQNWHGCHDRAIRSERHFYVSMNYIHNNPVKHGHVRRAYQWPDSSVHFYMELWGIETLREMWQQYPVLNYGENWDW